jgi:predicted DNA-binding transcriptional regulator AlpA
MHARQRAPEQRYGSPEQCAEYLGASRAWFLEHVAPHLKVVMIGTRRVFSFDEIDAWWARMATGGETTASSPTTALVRRPVGRPRRII